MWEMIKTNFAAGDRNSGFLLPIEGGGVVRVPGAFIKLEKPFALVLFYKGTRIPPCKVALGRPCMIDMKLGRLLSFLPSAIEEVFPTGVGMTLRIPEEKRSYHRVAVRLRAEITQAEGTFGAEIVNISRFGFCLQAKPALQEGQSFCLTVYLEDGSSLQCVAAVRRCERDTKDRGHYGLSIVSIGVQDRYRLENFCYHKACEIPSALPVFEGV